MAVEFALGSGYNEPMRESDSVNAAASGQKLTYDDFVLFPDDGMRHEIIDGEPYVSHPRRTSGSLLIASWLETRDVGKVFMAPLDVLLSHFEHRRARPAGLLERTGGGNPGAAARARRAGARCRDRLARHAHTQHHDQGEPLRTWRRDGILGRRSGGGFHPPLPTNGAAPPSPRLASSRVRPATCTQPRSCPAWKCPLARIFRE